MGRALALELLQQDSHLDRVFIAVSGGGFGGRRKR